MYAPALRYVLLGSAASICFANAAHAEMPSDDLNCGAQVCHARMTAAELLENAQHLVAERRFSEAAPMIAALENAPQYAMERQFLAGYSAIETGDLDGGIKQFRAALVNHPEQTRIRLELARALMLQGKTASADHHFRLAGKDSDLPEDVLRTIRTSRGILRNQRQWSFNLDFGLAPDTNITNGTSATTVDANFGPLTIPLTLSGSARQKSGTGQTFSTNGSARIGLFGDHKLVIDGDIAGVNYKGKSFDDFTGQLAIGPAFQLSDDASLTVQALGNQRYYGGSRASTGLGGRASFQLNIDNARRVGVSLDARHTNSGFSSSYSGWQIGSYATFEQVISRRFIGSASLFGRRDALKSGVYASREFGANLGIGGELPHGITAGISGGLSKAVFDKPFSIFSTQPRRDLRLSARMNVGLRQMRWLGFSPAVTYSFTKSASSLPLYDSSRHRVAFTFARYF
jgi:outer membrane protein